MGLPIAQAHPAEIVFAIEALHVIASTVLLNANVAFGAVFGVGTNIVGRFAVVRTFGQPFLDDLAVCGRMIVHAAFKTKCCMAGSAGGTFRADFASSHQMLAIGTGTKTQFRMRFDIVLEGKLLIFVAYVWACHQREH